MRLSLALPLLAALVLCASPLLARQRIDQDGRVSFTLPNGWEQQQHVRATRADRLRFQGISYEAEDEQTLDLSLVFFIRHNFDPDLPFDLETAEASDFTVELHTYYNAFERWIWKHGWCLGDPDLSFLPMTRSCRVVGMNGALQRAERFGPGDPRMPFAEGTGFVYTAENLGPYALDYRYHIYNVVVGETCYQIRIGGIARHFDADWPAYEQILKSMTFAGEGH